MKRLPWIALMVCFSGCIAPPELYVAYDRLSAQMDAIKADTQTLAADRWDGYEAERRAEIERKTEWTYAELAKVGQLTPANAVRVARARDEKLSELAAVKARFWTAIGQMHAKADAAKTLIDRLAAWHAERNNIITDHRLPILGLVNELFPSRVPVASLLLGLPVVPTTQPSSSGGG